MVRIAIDAMGGDHGSAPIINGAIAAMKESQFIPVFVGNRDEILLQLPSDLHNSVEIVEAEDVIGMGDSATDALKRKESSIYKSVTLVREKKADAVVSAGHSGATMSLATLRIGRLKGVMRPAIATLMPTKLGGRTLVLDVGANVDSEAEHLFQFAIMGKAYATDLLGINKPKVGLLANGEEPSKGNKVVKEAHEILKNTPDFNFIGNVEGSDIFTGEVDVVVCDGFVGNVLLKTGEGVATSVSYLLKKFIKESYISMLGAILSKGAFSKLKKELDYAEYGGAPLIGINGCAIVSHGKSNEKAIKNAILQAINFVESGVNEDILEYLEKYGRE